MRRKRIGITGRACATAPGQILAAARAAALGRVPPRSAGHRAGNPTRNAGKRCSELGGTAFCASPPRGSVLGRPCSCQDPFPCSASRSSRDAVGLCGMSGNRGVAVAGKELSSPGDNSVLPTYLNTNPDVLAS